MTHDYPTYYKQLQCFTINNVTELIYPISFHLLAFILSVASSDRQGLGTRIQYFHGSQAEAPSGTLHVSKIQIVAITFRLFDNSGLDFLFRKYFNVSFKLSKFPLKQNLRGHHQMKFPWGESSLIVPTASTQI